MTRFKQAVAAQDWATALALHRAPLLDALALPGFTGTIGIWGYIGVVPLLTGLMGWCPPYAMLGFNTCSTKQ